MTTFIDHQAQEITVQTEESFGDFASRIHRTSRRQLRYRDGAMIELKPDLDYVNLKLGLRRDPQTGKGFATPELFESLSMAIMGTVKQFESQEMLPEDWVQSVATTFDVVPPQIPQKFLDELEEGEELVFCLVGELGLVIEKRSPQPAPVEQEEEPE